MQGLLEADDHVALVHWWRERDEGAARLVHVDLHHDLGGDARPGPVGGGNVVRAGIQEGRVHHVTWVVPFERRRLTGEIAGALLATLPDDIRPERVVDGRCRARLDHVVIDVRGADDLPVAERDDTPVELSVDLDFLYHPGVSGPTVSPPAFLSRLLAWRRRARPRATFLATGLAVGYCPPTYTPVAVWLHGALHSHAVPAGSRELWRRVLARERWRLGGAAARADNGVIGTLWRAYLERRWEDLQAHLPHCPPPLRFHPREELLVEMQAGRPWPEEMRSRVEEATGVLGTAWTPRGPDE